MTFLIDFFKKWTLFHWLLAGLLLASGSARFITLSDRATHCDDNGFLLNALPALSAFEAADNVSKAWTYAPGQFLVGYPFWSKATTFEAVTRAARMPSAVAATAGTVLFFFLILLLQRQFAWTSHGGAFTAMLAALSMRLMVESQQGYSYAVTYLFAALQILVIVWFVQNGTAWTRWLYAMGAALAVGLVGLFFSYQLLFPSAAAGLTCAIGAGRELFRREKQAPPWLGSVGAACAGVAGFGAAYFWLWKAYLEVLLKNGTNVPPWAQFEIIRWSAAEGLTGYLSAIATKVVLLFSFLTAPIWPALLGATAQLLWGGAMFLLAAAGFLIGLRSSDATRRALALYGGLMLMLMLMANLAGQIPLGVTRHSFILFVPVLGLLLVAELHFSNTPSSRRRWILAAAAGLLLFYARFDEFNAMTANQFDVARVSKEVLARRPLSLVALDCTWDPRIAQVVSKGSAFPCGIVENASAAIRTLEATSEGGTMLLTSHRGDPLTAVAAELQLHPDWKTERIIAIEPRGSTEPIGMVNGGNGFFLAGITRPMKLATGCAVIFGSGWGVREGTADWWRWTDHGGPITFVSSQPEKLTIKGLVVSTTPNNTLRQRLDGNPLANAALSPGTVLDLGMDVAGAPRELELLSANAGIKLPPDTRTFAMQARNWKVTGEKSGPCEIR